jgi:hypothetical protein
LNVAPGHRAAPSPPAEQATTADADEIGSLPLKGNYESRASEDVLRGVGQGRAAVSTIALRATVDHGLCGNAPYRSK